MQALLDVGFKWRAELRRVMATMGSRGGYNSDRLLNRCAALESLDRRLHGRKRRSFRTRMSALADIAGAPFTDVVGDIDAWTKQLRDRRDHVAHHLVLEDPHGGLIDRMLSESAYLLFVLRLLREAHMPNAVFDLALKSKRVRQLRDLPNAIALHANR